MLAYLVKGKPFILFVDFKSKQILELAKEIERAVEFTPELKQFHEVERAVVELGALGETEKLSPVYQALADGNYAFVFATTHSNVKQAGDRKVYVAHNKEMMRCIYVYFETVLRIIKSCS